MIMYWNNLKAQQQIQEFLNNDKIILSSTDTVFGLLGRLTQKSYDNINQIKQRSQKPCIILIDSVNKLPKFIDQQIDEKIKKIVELSWPGPITLIFKARSDLPIFMKNNDNTIALRIPNHAGLLNILKNYDGLFSTSANIHTEPIPQSINEINKQILNSVAGMCIDSLDSFNKLSNSTILDCSSKNIKIVRNGNDLNAKLKELIK